MKTADEMFDMIGYEKHKSIVNDLYYENKENDAIYFYEDTKSFEKINFEKIESIEITMKELQAINKKCQELGWIK